MAVRNLSLLAKRKIKQLTVRNGIIALTSLLVFGMLLYAMHGGGSEAVQPKEINEEPADIDDVERLANMGKEDLALKAVHAPRTGWWAGGDLGNHQLHDGHRLLAAVRAFEKEERSAVEMMEEIDGYNYLLHKDTKPVPAKKAIKLSLKHGNIENNGQQTDDDNDDNDYDNTESDKRIETTAVPTKRKRLRAVVVPVTVRPQTNLMYNEEQHEWIKINRKNNGRADDDNNNDAEMNQEIDASKTEKQWIKARKSYLRSNIQQAPNVVDKEKEEFAPTKMRQSEQPGQVAIATEQRGAKRRVIVGKKLVPRRDAMSETTLSSHINEHIQARPRNASNKAEAKDDPHDDDGDDDDTADVRQPQALKGSATERRDENKAGKTTLYVYCEGSLGAQLFQYSTLFGVSRETNRPARAPPAAHLHSVFSALRLVPARAPSDVAVRFESEADYFSTRIYQLEKRPTMLCCFLRSWKYFQAYESELRSQFVFNSELLSSARTLLQKLTLLHRSRKRGRRRRQIHTYIGVHIRAPPQIGAWTQDNNQKHLVTYLEKAMNYFRRRYSHPIFVVATNDMNFSLQALRNRTDVVYTEQTIVEADLAVLSLCNHTVITSGATGWWAGWFSTGEVFYYQPRSASVNKDYYLPHWRRLSDS